MRSLVLPLAILVAALTGCAADDKPDAAWAMALCKRSLDQDMGAGAWTTGPLGFKLVDARAVTLAEAKDLGGRLPTDAGKSTGFAASCKVRFAHPKLASIRKGAQPAVLAFEGGSTKPVDDQYWAK
jgi:hypothetical protein